MANERRATWVTKCRLGILLLLLLLPIYLLSSGPMAVLWEMASKEWLHGTRSIARLGRSLNLPAPKGCISVTSIGGREERRGPPNF
jgi:hypothetical protein